MLGIEVGLAWRMMIFDDFDDFIKWNLMISVEHMGPFYRTYDELKQETHARDDMENTLAKLASSLSTPCSFGMIARKLMTIEGGPLLWEY